MAIFAMGRQAFAGPVSDGNNLPLSETELVVPEVDGLLRRAAAKEVTLVEA